MQTSNWLIVIVLGAIIGMLAIINNKVDNLKAKPIRYMRDYQIQTTTDSMFIIDNSRVVGVIPYGADKLSGIILQDNE